MMPTIFEKSRTMERHKLATKRSPTRRLSLLRAGIVFGLVLQLTVVPCCCEASHHRQMAGGADSSECTTSLSTLHFGRVCSGVCFEECANSSNRRPCTCPARCCGKTSPLAVDNSESREPVLENFDVPCESVGTLPNYRRSRKRDSSASMTITAAERCARLCRFLL